MAPELGQFALCLALACALVQASLPLYGAWRGNLLWMRLAHSSASAQCLMVVFAFGLLAWAFIDNDFSVAYVAANSNTALPLGYRVSAVWGAHEGSLLLWTMVLAIWTFAVSRLSTGLPPAFIARVIAVMG